MKTRKTLYTFEIKLKRFAESENEVVNKKMSTSRYLIS